MRFYWPIAKVDAEQRMVWGYASTEAEDDQGETVTRAALSAALDDYMRFANIREMHRPSAVGVATEATIDDKGLYLGARIVDSDAWQKVVEGVYKGFSIGGRVTARDPADRSVITGLALTEISVVDRPANPEAVFDCWKLLAGRAAEEPTGPSRDDDQPQGNRDQGHRHEVEYADPGYQADGQKRYPIDSARHVRAAWAYIHHPANARRYTPDQLAHVRTRIVAAWRELIDPHGPPEATPPGRRAAGIARKGIVDIGDLAASILDLQALQQRLAVEAAIEGDDPASAQLLARVIGDLREFLALLTGADDPTAPEPDDEEGGDIAAVVASRNLHKARRSEPAISAGLAKLAGAILPRLDALQKRIDDIANTPLPPQTIARGFVGFAKGDDGAARLAGDDIVTALSRLSEEERALTLIKLAHQSPITTLARPG